MRVALLAVVYAGLLRKQAPQIDYTYNPPLPNDQQVLETASESANAATLASSEAYTAAAEQASAEASAAGAQAALKSWQSRAATEAKVKEATETARKVAKVAAEAEAAAKEAREVAEGIPARVQAAAAKAAAEVIAKAKEEMKEGANATIETVKEQQKGREETALDAVSKAGEPYRAAEMRQSKLARDDVVQARDFAEAVTPIKNEAMKTMLDAVEYQKKGNVVTAQQFALKAHDLMDKAMQMQGHANSLQNHANGLQGNMGMYNLAAKQAEDYAAYAANPVGAPPPIPPLPAALQ